MKTMRVVPKTILANNLLDQKLIDSSVDINSIEYIVKFQDEKVSLMHKYFSKWQDNIKHQAYEIQADSRGQIREDKNRAALRSQLGKIREINYCFLRACVDCAEASNTKKELELQLINLHSAYMKKYGSSQNFVGGIKDAQTTIPDKQA